MLRVGAIRYINTLPLFLGIRDGYIPCHATIIEGVPSNLNRRLKTKELDLSMVSSAEYLARDSQYERIPHFCIAAGSEVMSVCLFSKYSVKDLSGKRIGLTSESMTSVQLLKILCRHFWKVDPIFIELTSHDSYESFDAILLIGDRCLMHSTATECLKIDLAEAWHRETGLPFVFAVLAAQKEINSEKKEAISLFCGALAESLNWSKNNSEIVLKQAEKQCQIGYEKLERYFSLLQYEMHVEHEAGLKLYQSLQKYKS